MRWFLRQDRFTRVALRLVFSFALAAFALTGCSADSQTAAPAQCPPEDPADLEAITQARAQLLLGFSERDAERCAAELGWAYRVGMRDGEPFALTMDYSLQRVTVVVNDDVVTAITVG
jgi:hypothetical protein